MTDGALEGLNTQHIIGNLEVDVSGRSASVKASNSIYRRLDQRVFQTHARYQWGMTRTGDRRDLSAALNRQ